MSKMHQMQLTYVPAEDRMLFRLNTVAGQEFRFWMTRRYVVLLHQTLTRLMREVYQKKIAASHPDEPVGPATIELQQTVEMETRHREQVQKADFQSDYEEKPQLPLGDEPILLFQVGIKPGPKRQALLCMHPQQGGGIELALNEQIVHSFCRLLSETSAKADWNLDLKLIGKQTGDEDSGLN